MTTANLLFHDQLPEVENMQEEVLAGLMARPKRISPKFFYDEKGSQLFDKITQLPEYYPTRTEMMILEQNCQAISDVIGREHVLVEYGSGSSDKIRILLNALQPSSYVALDISKDHLISSVQSLMKDYSWLTAHAACVDYSKPVELEFIPLDKKRVAFFPGSSIGNFEPRDAKVFLTHVRETVGAQGGLLIGVDLKKEIEVLNAAYNDQSGVTAAFNQNVLVHLNEVLDAGFQVDQFQHEALYNEQLGRIEMYLRSEVAQQAKVADRVIDFGQHERIHTESSYKYHIEEFATLAYTAGFTQHQVWTDTQNYFAVFYLSA